MRGGSALLNILKQFERDRAFHEVAVLFHFVN